MHGSSRLGSGRSVAITTTAMTPSPSSSPRFRHGRHKKTVGRDDGLGGRGSKQRVLEGAALVIISVVLKRKCFLLFVPLLYIAGMLLFMGSLNFDVVNNLKNGVAIMHHKRATPGSIYRSPQVFDKLWPYMEAEDLSHNNTLMTAWDPKLQEDWKPCGNRIISNAGLSNLPKSNGFLIIEANGGLNQQRLSICDAVAVAGLLNATLVIPIFHLNSVWRDSSKFGDIFDEDFFIHTLRNNVNVVPELPADVLEQFDNNISSIVNLRVKAWSSPTYYLHKVVPKLVQLGAVRIAPFSNRLAQAVSSNIQGLRCLANFEALRFSETIRTLAEKMVDRMVKKSTQTGGKYVSVHLRFEMDMVAFSCCEYDGGEVEKHEMDMARERGWRGKFRKRGRVIKPGANRVEGKCPLTPLEVGMMLRGMGFDNTTSVYMAAGKIYNAEKYLAPLRQMFPRLETKDTLATPEEVASFKGHSSRLAALDYTVCLHSEVFVTTQGGNFPHFLMGHRRYLYGGHAKTIKPDKRKLALLFDRPSISWEYFKRQMREMFRHNDVKGSEVRKPSGSLYTFPMPDCMCKQLETKNEDRNSRRVD
ncbi:O-FucT domain-containing protein [Cephalotus follicularis]|uniref:O-fucosyltransferase family protein n=1 Tax=Cephalotus follicularis TaxID=3775 RepID=A0A1Q3CVE9_CEPFO|nr:O-FucT domain-containing protein [Cephalotus follicularis]